MTSSRRIVPTLLACALGLALTGCVGVSLTTQERPFGKAVDDFNTRTELNARLLGESPQLFANVSTTVIEGRVHLSGTVPTNDERLKATRLAWATPNVRESSTTSKWLRTAASATSRATAGSPPKCAPAS
jgi:hypothetical protein